VISTVDLAIAGALNLDTILYGLPQELPMEKELLESGFITSLGILQQSWTTILYPSVFPQIVHT
jgi:hypothetical protein